jgi:hypothetical protein
LLSKKEEVIQNILVDKSPKELQIDYAKINFKTETYPKVSMPDVIPKLTEAKTKKEHIPVTSDASIIQDLQKVDSIKYADFGLEVANDNRVWFKSNIQQVHELAQKGALIHEALTNNIRFCVDLDDKYNRISNFKNVFLAIATHFGGFFQHFYKNLETHLSEPIDEKETNNKWFNWFITMNTTTEYKSAHMYFDVYANNKLVFSHNAEHQSIFWREFKVFLDNKYSTDVFSYVIDTAIYRKNAQLRVPFAVKDGTYHKPLNCGKVKKPREKAIMASAGYKEMVNGMVFEHEDKVFQKCKCQTECDCEEIKPNRIEFLECKGNECLGKRKVIDCDCIIHENRKGKFQLTYNVINMSTWSYERIQKENPIKHYVETKQTLKGKMVDRMIQYGTETVFGMVEPFYSDFYARRFPDYGQENIIYVPEILDESIITEPYRYTQFEKEQFAKYLEETKIDISGRQMWSQAAYKIWCFYAMFHTATRINTVVDFFASRGWASQENKLENIQLCMAFLRRKRHTNFTLLKLKEFFKITDFSIKVEMPKISYIELEKIMENHNVNKRVIALKSSCSTGKTASLFEELGHEKLLFVVPRCSLGFEIQDKFGKKEDEEDIDQKYKKYDLEHYKKKLTGNKSGICQLDSLWKFEKILHKYDRIVFDECELTCNQFSFFHSKQSYAFSTLESCMKYIFSEKKVILMSANLGTQTRYLLDVLGVEKPAYFENTYAKQKGLEYHELFSRDQWLAKVIELRRLGKKIIIPVNSLKFSQAISNTIDNDGEYINNQEIFGLKGKDKEYGEYQKEKQKKALERKIAEADKFKVEYEKERNMTEEERVEARRMQELADEIQREADSKILVINSCTPLVPVEKWYKYDVVIYSPTISAGNSIDEKHFDTVCAYFYDSAGTWDMCFQMLFRLRNILDNKIYIFVDDFIETFNKKGELIKIKTKLEKQDLTDVECAYTLDNEQMSQYNESDILKVLEHTDACFDKLKYSTPLQKMIIFQDHYIRHSRYRFKKCLFGEFSILGMKNVTPQNSERQAIVAAEELFAARTKKGKKEGLDGESLDGEKKPSVTQNVNRQFTDKIIKRNLYLKNIEEKKKALSEVNHLLLMESNDEPEAECKLSEVKEQLEKEVIDNKELFGPKIVDLEYKLNMMVDSENMGEAFEYLGEESKKEQEKEKDEKGKVLEEQKKERVQADSPFTKIISAWNYLQMKRGNFKDENIKHFMPVIELIKHIGSGDKTKDAMYDCIIEFVKIKGNKLFATQGNNRRHTIKNILGRKGKHMYNLAQTINIYLEPMNCKLAVTESFCHLKAIDLKLVDLFKQEYKKDMKKTYSEIIQIEQINDMPN